MASELKKKKSLMYNDKICTWKTFPTTAPSSEATAVSWSSCWIPCSGWLPLTGGSRHTFFAFGTARSMVKRRLTGAASLSSVGFFSYPSADKNVKD